MAKLIRSCWSTFHDWHSHRRERKEERRERRQQLMSVRADRELRKGLYAASHPRPWDN